MTPNHPHTYEKMQELKRRLRNLAQDIYRTHAILGHVDAPAPTGGPALSPMQAVRLRARLRSKKAPR